MEEIPLVSKIKPVSPVSPTREEQRLPVIRTGKRFKQGEIADVNFKETVLKFVAAQQRKKQP